MGRVDRCLPNDIPAVADLHNRVLFQSSEASSERLRRYYRTVFFENPWYDDEQPSLVYRTNGKVAGFLGCVPRRMIINGQTVRVATLHRLLVARDVDSPLAAFQLVQEVLSGPQDLTFADGANDNGRRILESSGASVSSVYSMKWLRPLRPCSFVLNMLSKRRPSLALISMVGRPVGTLMDSLACRLAGSPFVLKRPDTREVELGADLLLRGIEDFSRNHLLRPSYDLRSLNWLLEALKDNEERGEFGGFGIFDVRDRFIGLCLYYLNFARVAEIVLLAARDDARDAVLRHLMYRTWRAGGVGLIGRLEPKFLKTFSDHDCLMKVGDWALVHGRNSELVHIVNRGEAFISALEGELWLRSPMDRL